MRQAFRRIVWILSIPGVLLTPEVARAGLEIHTHSLSGIAPADMVGGGTIDEIFRAAADVWQQAFNAPSTPWVVDLAYQWETLKAPTGNSGKHSLVAQGGSPSRETAGLIQFDNSANTSWFADPNPANSTAYTDFQEETARLGNADINVARYSVTPHGDAIGRMDLFSIALHEIGHALGLSTENTEYDRQVVGLQLPITMSPWQGASLFLFTDHLTQFPFALMTPIQNVGTRYRISAVDVLANAQLSQFSTPNFDPYVVPEPSTLSGLIMALGGVGLIKVIRFRLSSRSRERAGRLMSK